MSALEAEFEDVFLGRPEMLRSRADDLVAAADAITRATESLRALVDGQHSRATDALEQTASEVARSLSRARIRYRQTGTALQTYAVELTPIQRSAREAVDSADYHEARDSRLASDIFDLEGAILRADAGGASPAALDRLDDELWSMRRSQSTAAQGVADARTALHSARERIRVIADAAIAQIETAIEGGKDTPGDNWNQFWEGVADIFGDWAAGVLRGVLEFLGEVLAVLVAIIVVVLLIVVVVVLIGAIIAAGLGALALVLAAALIGTMLLAFLLRDGLGAPKGPAIREPNPTVKKPSDADTADSPEAFTSEDYGDLFQEVGRQDTLGGEENTVVRVVAIIDAAGRVIGYRVQLPSTQNWGPDNIDGALNDLSADAMLALFPGVETQYEKAVWDALERAGALDGDAPIMLTGWSLGGMMAGQLASDPRISDRVTSVVTAGSAIDKHAGTIDPAVRVTQINNRWDPVHTLELVGYDPFTDEPGPNWQTYRPTDLRVHDATMYGELADDYIPDVRPGDEIFFADDVEGTEEQVYEMVSSRG